MSLIQFLRILWAWRWLVLAATASCLIGAYVAILIVPPRWEAHSRVMLNMIKPDPVTGEVVAGPSERTYMATQVELITDYAVASQVVDQLGWLSDPALIEQYQHRSAKDGRDFAHWAAQLVIDRTKAKVIEGSNILEIDYRASSADEAKQVADALSKAYMDYSLNYRRNDASQTADWYAAQAVKAKAALDAAQAAEVTYEHDNGIIMQDATTDVDTARLRALAAAGAVPAPVMSIAPTTSAASLQLAQLDAQIAQASQQLGPNHPELIQLRAQRASVAALAAQDQAAARAAMAASSGNAAGAVDRALASQKSRVLAQGDKLGQLTELQAETDMRRDQYNKIEAHEADQRQEAETADAGISVLSNAVTPKSPAFPNKLLIIPGSFVLGLGVGVLVSLLMEFFARRIRGVEDLQWAIDAPLLGVIGARSKKRTKGAQFQGPTLSSPCRARPIDNVWPAHDRRIDHKPRTDDLVETVGGRDHIQLRPVACGDLRFARRAGRGHPRRRTHLVAQHIDEGRRAIAVCAASAGAGCSFVASNLAVAFSQIGLRTLLVDCDLRNPALDRVIRSSTDPLGLRQCLATSDMSFADAISFDVLPNLAIMYSGGSRPQVRRNCWPAPVSGP